METFDALGPGWHSVLVFAFLELDVAGPAIDIAAADAPSVSRHR